MAVLLGRTSAGANADFNGTPQTAAWPFVASASGKLAVIKGQTKVANGTSTAITMSVWDDVGGFTRPGNLLGLANVDSLAAAQGTGVFQATLSPTVTIVSATNYWLAWSSSSANFDFQGDTSGSYIETTTNPAVNPWPSSGNTFGTFNAIIWGESANGGLMLFHAIPFMRPGRAGL